VKIAVGGKVLPDQRRADHCSIAFDHTSIRLRRQGELRNSGDRERIDDSGQRGEKNDHDDRRTNLGEHLRAPYAR
jgi:hypothetical protein